MEQGKLYYNTIFTGETIYILPTRDSVHTIWTNTYFSVWWYIYYKRKDFPVQLSYGLKHVHEKEKVLMLILDREYVGDRR